MTASLDALLSDPGSAGIFLDFDGTLSEIVDEPADARPLDGATAILHRLRDRFSTVAVISGRSAAELVEWLGPGLEIHGLHGGEVTWGDEITMAADLARYLEPMNEVRRRARVEVDRLGLDGVIVEDKGPLITLHFRASPDPNQAAETLELLADQLARAHGLEILKGRMAIELRPPASGSKADVILSRVRAEGLKAAAFFGDDWVDLPAFDALDLLAAEGCLVVRVAVRSSESPPDLLSRADLVVDGPRGVLSALEGWAETP